MMLQRRRPPLWTRLERRIPRSKGWYVIWTHDTYESDNMWVNSWLGAHRLARRARRDEVRLAAERARLGFPPNRKVSVRKSG